MRVGIYSIVSVNYGNRLQNYALQETLRKMNITAETFRREEYKFYRKVRDALRSLVKKDRHSNYVDFDKRINWSHEYISENHVPANLQDRYDYFVIGSDQIWNPTFPFSSSLDYLPFISKEKKVSVAASFGVSEIDEQYENIVRQGINSIGKISVREEDGVNIVYKYTLRDAELLIDPTLMLGKSEWEKVYRKPKGIDFSKEYILTYFLGDKTNEVIRDIDLYANNGERNVYSFLDKNQPAMYECGPAEFIYMIAHAKLILTDSFHATVFSFIFYKPFLVYARETAEKNMMSRINTLLKTFGLERKYVGNGIFNDVFECDYSYGIERLNVEREKFINFLKSSLAE